MASLPTRASYLFPAVTAAPAPAVDHDSSNTTADALARTVHVAGIPRLLSNSLIQELLFSDPWREDATRATVTLCDDVRRVVALGLGAAQVAGTAMGKKRMPCRRACVTLPCLGPHLLHELRPDAAARSAVHCPYAAPRMEPVLPRCASAATLGLPTRWELRKVRIVTRGPRAASSSAFVEFASAADAQEAVRVWSVPDGVRLTRDQRVVLNAAPARCAISGGSVTDFDPETGRPCVFGWSAEDVAKVNALFKFDQAAFAARLSSGSG